jgi:hypothetical protein
MLLAAAQRRARLCKIYAVVITLTFPFLPCSSLHLLAAQPRVGLTRSVGEAASNERGNVDAAVDVANALEHHCARACGTVVGCECGGKRLWATSMQ